LSDFECWREVLWANKGIYRRVKIQAKFSPSLIGFIQWLFWLEIAVQRPACFSTLGRGRKWSFIWRFMLVFGVKFQWTELVKYAAIHAVRVVLFDGAMAADGFSGCLRFGRNNVGRFRSGFAIWLYRFFGSRR
ncbi:MAG: hypothetical protein NTW32_19905, partial [Chloroflexi bacterium]|nr:hypothetical protein [Chloroflexota bacterium]